MINHTKATFLLAFASVAAFGWSQDRPTLSLDDALRLAMNRNGTIKAARANVQASKFNLTASQSSFLPTISPSYSYTNSQSRFYTGTSAAAGDIKTNEHSLQIDGTYRLLDSGQRSATTAQAKNSLAATTFNATQTVRGVLVTVYSQYYDALRSAELLRVNQDQLKRAEEILKYTQAKFDVGAGPKKDILQAQADALNAKSNVLVQSNRVETTWASLKATIGWDDTTMPALASAPDVSPERRSDDLKLALQTGLKNRPDLRGLRAQTESAKLEVRLADIDSKIQYSLDLSSRYAFSPDVFRRGGLVVNATIPLFDGKRSKSLLAARREGLNAQLANLVQQEREALAEIESSYKQYDQGFAILDASKLALEAAKENYRVAEFGARPDIGKSTLLEIRNAQVTLTTAEVNYVQALYDVLIADVRYRVAIGEALAAEKN